MAGGCSLLGVYVCVLLLLVVVVVWLSFGKGWVLNDFVRNCILLNESGTVFANTFLSEKYT